jgi:NitT/TauT family transport system permease protein
VRRLINIKPPVFAKLMLGLAPFLLLLIVYVNASGSRLAENPNDKLLPAFSTIQQSMTRMAFEPSKRTGQYLFWVDTASSLKRLLLGVVIAAAIGLAWGLLTGAMPLVSAALSPLLTVVSVVPTLALLPILFIVFGLGELSKVMLIIIGVTPFIARDIQKRALEIPAEQLIKAQTLGANTAQIIFSVLLPQLLPKLIGSVRLSLGAGWLFLIAAEAIASTDGLGYRIFLVRRYLSMDVILPYVAWITLLAFIIDFLLRRLHKRLYPWDSHEGNR